MECYVLILCLLYASCFLAFSTGEHTSPSCLLFCVQYILGMTGAVDWAADRIVDQSSWGVARHSLLDSMWVSVQVSTAACLSVTEGRAEVLFTA